MFTFIDRAGTADDAVMASIVAAGSLHAELAAVGSGVHGIYELDVDSPVDRQVDDHDGISHASTSSGSSEPVVGPSSTSTAATTQGVPTVNVLVVFTTASKARYGDISRIAATDIDRANGANYAGGITSRFALAGLREVV